MGYYTRYKGSYSGEGFDLAKFEDDIEYRSDEIIWSDYDFDLDWWIEDDGESVKWYAWKEDVEALSLQYPNVLFMIEGDGEEQGDQWKSFTRNGKTIVTKAIVTFEEPDLTSLPWVDTAGLHEADLLKKQKEIEVRRAEIDTEIEKLRKRRDELSRG